MELLERILERENLNEAYKRVYVKKGASGVDGVTVDELKAYLTEHKAELLESICTRKYKPPPVRRVEIPKDNGKKRSLGIPTVVDRVLQQAIAQVLSPIYEEQFSNSSYGFRIGKNCGMAVTRSLELINEGYSWIVDIDLDSYNSQCLKQRAAKAKRSNITARPLHISTFNYKLNRRIRKTVRTAV
jgi:retron-type reverse transcriptase